LKTLKSALDKLLKKYGIEEEVWQAEAILIWNDVVGKTIASHTEAHKVSYGKLFIKVDSPVWRNELLFQKKEILARINRRLQKTKIKEIVLR